MASLYEKLAELENAGGAGVLITVIGMDGSGPSEVGGKMLFLSGGETLGTVGGGDLERLACERAKAMLTGDESDQPATVPYALGGDGGAVGMVCGGTVSLFYERIGPGDNVTIFGAGHIGRALLRHLRGLGLFTTIVDERPEQLALVEGASRCIDGRSAAIGGHYVVIATYTHDLDFEILSSVLKQSPGPRYIGVVASARKRELFLSQLGEKGLAAPPEGVVHMPAGLDIGGRSPDEIALSIAAEIQAIRYERQGHRHMGG